MMGVVDGGTGGLGEGIGAGGGTGLAGLAALVLDAALAALVTGAA